MQQIMYCVLPDNFWPLGHFHIILKFTQILHLFICGPCNNAGLYSMEHKFYVWYMITIKFKNSTSLQNFGSFVTYKESFLKGQIWLSTCEKNMQTVAEHVLSIKWVVKQIVR
jgi:hypothetical protein